MVVVEREIKSVRWRVTRMVFYRRSRRREKSVFAWYLKR